MCLTWMNQTKLRFLSNIIYGILIALVGYGGYTVGVSVGVARMDATEQHDLCHDTKTHEGWIARKQGIVRCFMENKQFPHRVQGSHIEALN